MKTFIMLMATTLLTMTVGDIGSADDKYHQWRTSETITSDTDVLIATGVIFVKDVVVASGTSSVAQLQLFNTTGTVAGGVSRSSSAIYDVSSKNFPIPIEQIYTKGLRYTKTGNSTIAIRWDWVLTVPKGQENRGLK